MALTSEEVAWVERITRERYASAPRAGSLNEAEETLLINDIEEWQRIYNSYVRLKGGSDGIDFDNERKRSAIFYRVRQLLGYPFLLYDLAGEVLELVEIELGQNFG
jgi:hypothetical protein